jgi:hypothetical protein
MLWRANRAKPVKPEETVSQQPTFGAAPAPEAIAA